MDGRDWGVRHPIKPGKEQPVPFRSMVADWQSSFLGREAPLTKAKPVAPGACSTTSEMFGDLKLSKGLVVIVAA